MKKKTILTLGISFIALVALVGGFILYQALTNEAPEDAQVDDGDFSPFFPSGTTNEQGTPLSSGSNTVGGQGDGSAFIPSEVAFQNIHTEPVVSSVFIRDDVEKESFRIRFMEQETGHVFERSIGTPSVTRLTNTTIPSVSEVLWGQNGSSTVLRYLSDDGERVETFVATIEPSDDSGKVGSLVGTFLNEDISSVALAPDTESFVYVLQEGIGSSLYIYSFETKRSRRIFSTPLTELVVTWPTDQTILLSTKPGFNIFGYTYRIANTGTGFSKILGPIRGLSTLANVNFSYLLYTQNGVLFSHTLATDNSTSLGLKTVIEKCVWSTTEPTTVYCAVPKNIESARFPDEWYQGLVPTRDVIWKLNISLGTGKVVFDPETEGLTLDVEYILVDEEEKYLLFKDRHTDSVYTLKL